MSSAIQPHQIASLLADWPDLRCLSLDCFDTLLWRDVREPRDLFHALPDTSLVQRVVAEARARRAVESRGHFNEVAIADIYRQLLPNAEKAAIQAAIEAELAVEARHCFAFAPVADLMRQAKGRGLKIVIVSDTYFDSAQLRRLIEMAAGSEIADLIDEVFCSSQFGKAKAQGLYGDVLRKLKLPPETILHLGDNAVADVGGVAPFGVNTVHLRQFTEACEQRLRLEATLDGMIHTSSSSTVAQALPHRAALALLEPQVEDAAERLGLTTLGPIFHGFDSWLEAEAAELEREHGGTVHWLFMMRDGHLARLVHAQARPDQPTHAIEISRFTATAASLRDDAALTRFLEADKNTPGDILARQMLVPEKEIDRLCTGRDPLTARDAVLAALKGGQMRKSVVRASRAYADRLVEHVRSTVKPAKGDTLMMVDLGYNGTVQNLVEPLLRERLQTHVAGRYLLMREIVRYGLDKSGYIGPDHHDAFTLDAMCSNVSVFEQLSTNPSGSVVDYEADGTPIRKANIIVSAQSEVRERVQQGCLRFQREAPAARTRADGAIEPQLWRQGAASALMRLMFLPMPEELAVIEAFEHDINLGTEQTSQLFDKDHSRQALRERGLFYMNASDRMYLPAELQGQGMATRLSLLTQRRFGLPLTFADSMDATIDLPVIFADQNNAVLETITASGTHDGHFMAAIPIGTGQFSLALNFGTLFEWLQIDSLTFYKVEDFLSNEPEYRRDRWDAQPLFENMVEEAKGLLRCETRDSFVMVPPPPAATGEPLLLACVFRPIVSRQDGVPATGAMQGSDTHIRAVPHEASA